MAFFHAHLRKVRVVLLDCSDTGLVKFEIRIALLGEYVYYTLYLLKMTRD
jgi:hypothetical protein